VKLNEQQYPTSTLQASVLLQLELEVLFVCSSERSSLTLTRSLHYSNVWQS